MKIKKKADTTFSASEKDKEIKGTVSNVYPAEKKRIYSEEPENKRELF